MNRRDRLEEHSLLLMLATLAGHAGNYAYHLICGRLLTENEYGLLMALFSGVNLILIPMGALSLALTRSISLLDRDDAPLRPAFFRWQRSLVLLAVVGLFCSLPWLPKLGDLLHLDRFAPMLLAALIPALNLQLCLSGAGLQGKQRFPQLALRGSILFATRGLLVLLCLYVGWRAAGWALLAHLLGMLAAQLFSIWSLRQDLQRSPEKASPSSHKPATKQALLSAPILLSFSLLLGADTLLARIYLDADSAGRFAQAAVLARMILWLPLPIAQAMFPKVISGHEQRHSTLKKALLYSTALLFSALGGCLLFAGLGLRILFGPEIGNDQILWVRLMGLAMLPLGMTQLLLYYELARGRIRRLWSLILGAALYLALSLIRHSSPELLLQNLLLSSWVTLSLLCVSLIPWRRSSLQGP